MAEEQLPVPPLPRKLAKFNEKLNNLTSWSLSTEAKDAVTGIGVEFFSNLGTKKLSHCKELIQALHAFYDIDNCVFRINNRTLVFSLEDVFYLTGLPIHGKPVSGVDGTAEEFFFAAFSMKPPDGAMRFGKISIGWLQKTFSEMKITPSHADWLPYLRAYLLYIIGSYIIPDSSPAYVSAFYLPLLHDVSAVGSYAWGEAALANFHHSMRSTSCNYGGLSYALMIFALERIPALVDLYLGQGVRYPSTFPLMVGWSEILYKRTSNQRAQISYEKFYGTLRNLQDVTWRPYLRITPDKIPEKYSANFKRAVASTILVSFYMVAFHKPELAPLQFGYRSARQYRYTSVPNSNVKKGPKKNIDLATVDPYVKFIELNRKRFPMIGEVTEGIPESRDLTEFVPFDNAEELLALLPTLEEPLDAAAGVDNSVGNDSR